MKSEDFVHEITQTSAIFGRNSEASVSFSGTEAYTDGKEIVLPSMPQGMELDNDAVMVMRGYLDHEAGHIRHTDFTNLKGFVNAHGEETKAIFNCLEDIRLEHKVMDEYPGAEKNLRALGKASLEEDLPKLEAASKLGVYGEDATFPNINLSILTQGRKEYSDKETYDKQSSFLTDKWKAWGDKWREEVLNCDNSNQVMNMAISIAKMLEQSRQDQKDKSEGKEPKNEGQGLDGDPSEFTFDKDGDPTKGDGKGNTSGKPTKAEANAASSEIGDYNSFCDKFVKKKIDGYLENKYSDKKVKYRVLTTKFDEVFSKDSKNKRKDERLEDLRKGTAQDYEKVKAAIGGGINTMKSRLRRALMATERRDWDFGREFGKLDTKRLAAGYQGVQSVYKQRKEREELDTSVMMLVDLSGSMSGRKVEVARDAVIAFSECMEGTQIKYQVVGFDNGACHSDTPGLRNMIDKAERSGKVFHRVEPLNIFKFKAFNEPLRTAKGAISTIDNMSNGNNSDRDAVLWCLQELSKQPTRRKILMVLSDGQPANYMIPDRNSSLLTTALKDVIGCSLRDYGVETVGIGILTDHVKNLYPKSVSIQNVNDLSGAIFTQLANLLTGGKVTL